MNPEGQIFFSALGAVGLAASAGSLGLYWYQARLADAIEDTPRSHAGEIRTPGGYHEVQGTVECEKPLAAPGQAGDCVWYRFTIVEEYQERTHHPRRGSQTRDVSETVLDRQEAVPFLLKDESGSIRVDPEGAHLDGKLVRGSAEDTTGNMVLPEMTLGGSRRLKGRRREIRLIPVGGPGYVLGRCVERDGVLVLARDELEAKPFVVSCRSERELLAGHELGLKAKLLLAVGGAVLGAASLLAAWGG